MAAFEGPQDFLRIGATVPRSAATAVVAAINAIPGLATPVPDGAFYCMVDAEPR